MRRMLIKIACAIDVSLLGFLVAALETAALVTACTLVVGGVDSVVDLDKVNTLVLIVILYQTLKHRLETEK